MRTLVFFLSHGASRCTFYHYASCSGAVQYVYSVPRWGLAGGVGRQVQALVSETGRRGGPKLTISITSSFLDTISCVHSADRMSRSGSRGLISRSLNAIASGSCPYRVSPALGHVAGSLALCHVHRASAMTPAPVSPRRYTSSQPSAQTSVSHQPPHIPIIRSLGQLRRWRRMVREQGMEVGVVPTVSQ
jgi:hypothetical protein